jgi:hypothetical protein
MHIHHIFIFTDPKGEAADELVNFGLIEGSGRVHPGQGTANRKFYFDNFFLEILWVDKQEEFNHDLIKSTGLCQRANHQLNSHSPFGLCLANEPTTDSLFASAYQYQPDYFPVGMTINVVTNDLCPQLPWTFRLPFKDQQKQDAEPRNHLNGLSVLTKAEFEYQTNDSDCENNYLDHFTRQSTIQFIKSNRFWLTLEFDNHRQGLTKNIESLFLTIKY